MQQNKLDFQVKKAAEKLAQLRAQLQARDQRQQAQARAEQKKQETRRLVLAGAFYLGQLGQNEALSAVINGVQFSAWLTRPSDRAAFGLPPILPARDGQEGGAQ